MGSECGARGSPGPIGRHLGGSFLAIRSSVRRRMGYPNSDVSTIMETFSRGGGVGPVGGDAPPPRQSTARPESPRRDETAARNPPATAARAAQQDQSPTLGARLPQSPAPRFLAASASD